MLKHHISVLVADRAGGPVGAFLSTGEDSASLHRQQHEKSTQPDFTISAARHIVTAKIANCRLVLRRYHRHRPAHTNRHDSPLAEIQQAVLAATGLDAVRGHEGAAARAYFDGLRALLPPPWSFDRRSRLPPRDPVNALLSYGYGILYHTMLTLICRRGLDPNIGSLHAGRDGHAALASDLIEEFRPLIIDATVLKLLLSGNVRLDDFEFRTGKYPVCLGSELRHRFVAAVDDKLSCRLNHPETGRPIDYRRAMLRQVATWAEAVSGTRSEYSPLILR